MFSRTQTGGQSLIFNKVKDSIDPLQLEIGIPLTSATPGIKVLVKMTQ